MSLFLVCGRCSYARMIKLIQSRKYFEGLNENEPDEESQKKIDDMNKITLDEAITKQIIAAGHISMGQAIQEQIGFPCASNDVVCPSTLLSSVDPGIDSWYPCPLHSFHPCSW